MVEIEITSPQQGEVAFYPLRRNLRSRFDARLARDRYLVDRWPIPIPGQVVGFDAATGDAWIREPLFEAEHEPTRRRIEKLGKALPAAKEVFAGVDVPTWAYWINRLVESKSATVVSGALPTVTGEPKKDWFKTEPNRLTKMIDKMLDVLGGLITLTPQQRKKFADALASE